MSHIHLVPVGDVDGDLLRALAERLARTLPVPLSPNASPLDPADAYDPVRRQFHSTRILELLSASRDVGEEGRVLGVIDRDIFVPILTFVFGEAQLGGSSAVFSLTRLRPTFYGLPRDEDVLLSRAEKEALHEVGHTFGLIHCPQADCVMRASTSADAVDLKPPSYCRSCSRTLVSRV